MAYHPAWEEGLRRGSLRGVLPNSNYDPQIGHRLLNRYLGIGVSILRKSCCDNGLSQD